MLMNNPVSLLLLTVLVAIVPLLVGVTTSYIKVSIVLSMVRSALGTQQTPGNMVIMALSLAITCFVMAPVFEASRQQALDSNILSLLEKPTLADFEQVVPVFEPWRQFMLSHCGSRELEVLAVAASGADAAVVPSEEIGQSRRVGAPADYVLFPWRVVLPAFVLSELKQAFIMGFALLLPFLVVDLIVANILVGLNMIMVSPIMVALPLKLILFVLSDGWLLITQSLINSYQG